MKKLAVLLCVLWMGVIFYNSYANTTVSNERSMKVLNIFQKVYHKVEPATKTKTQVITANPNKNVNLQSSHIEKLNLIIRKNAHAFEYIVLAIFACNALFINKIRGRGAIIYVLFICLLYAVTDEFHQLFVPGRGSLVSDVLIDFLGAIIGLGLFYFTYYKIYPKFKKSKISTT